MLKKFRQGCIAALLALFTVVVLAQTSMAIAVKAVPNPRQEYGGWVMDTTGLIAPQTGDRLNELIDRFEQETSHEIAVAIVPDVRPSKSTQEFATQLFNRWGIGKAKKNNGVLFLVSRNDRRTEIKPGRGVSQILTPARSRAILQQYVTPKFKAKQFDAGITAGVEQIIQTLRQSPPVDRSVQSRGGTTVTGPMAIVMTLLIVGLVLFITLGLPAIGIGLALLHVFGSEETKRRWFGRGKPASYGSERYEPDYGGFTSDADSGSDGLDSVAEFGGGAADADSGGGDSW